MSIYHLSFLHCKPISVQAKKYFQKSPPRTVIHRLTLWRCSTRPVQLVHPHSIYFDLVDEHALHDLHFVYEALFAHDTPPSGYLLRLIHAEGKIQKFLILNFLDFLLFISLHLWAVNGKLVIQYFFLQNAFWTHICSFCDQSVPFALQILFMLFKNNFKMFIWGNPWSSW